MSRLSGAADPSAVDAEEAEWRAATSTPGETMEVGKRLGSALTAGDVVALIGELGSGKTLFTKGICAGLGVHDPRRVSSPTYVLEHVYAARAPVHHYDAYRLQSGEEFLALGFQERARTGGILLIEWADKVLSVLPHETLGVRFSVIPGTSPAGDGTGPGRRLIVLSGVSRPWAARLEPIFGAAARIV